MANQFNSVKLFRPRRNVFNLGYESKLTGKFGQLIPIMCQEVLPSDRFKLKTEHFIRMSPLLAPVMQNLDVSFQYFFVPTRLLWDDFADFISGGVTGNDAPDYPLISTLQVTNCSLADYLGFPTLTGANKFVDALPFRAYQLIYNEYYRDQNLEDPVEFSTGSGDVSTTDVVNLTTLRYRKYRKDYFTSALPFTQRGPEAMIPIGTTIPQGSLTDLQPKNHSPFHSYIDSLPTVKTEDTSSGSFHNVVANDPNQTQYFRNTQDFPDHDVELSDASASIRNLRRMFRLQEFFERAAVAGGRMKETIMAFFGQKTSDSRLQRPEFLGTSKSRVIISEQLQTSETTDTSVLGQQSGQGLSLGGNYIFNRKFEEWGYIIGIMSFVPRASYYQGTPRKFLRRSRFDYYWPQFAHIGEQAIINTEIYGTAISPTPLADDIQSADTIFGYSPRYAEYRFNNDEVHGNFRGNLDFWHLGRKFSSTPKLSAEFLNILPSDNDRIFTVLNDGTNDNVDQFMCQLRFYLTATRSIPRYGTPTL